MTGKDPRSNRSSGILALAACAGIAATVLGVGGDLASRGDPAPRAHAEPAPVPDARRMQVGYQMFLDPAGRLVNLVLPLEHYDRLSRSARFPSAEYRLITHLVHNEFLDVFDFVIVAFDGRQPWEGNDTLAGSTHRARVVADGLGLGERRRYYGWGTDGPLSSVIFLKDPERLRSGLLLHEIAHTWGQDLLPTQRPDHWGWSSVNGLLGGWEPGSLRRVGDGTWEPRGNRPDRGPFRFHRDHDNRRSYADLELYLMGLLPADSVGPVEMAVGATTVPERGARFTAERLDTLTIEDLVAAHGPRDPAWPDAKRDFRGIVVILSMLPLDVETMHEWSEVVRDLGTPAPDGNRDWLNFWEATAGRATLRLDDLPSVLRYDSAVPGTELHCSAEAARDSLTSLQARVLALVPHEEHFRQRSPPTRELGYTGSHGFAVVDGMGMTLVNPRAEEPMPQLLFYMPDDTASSLDWTSFRTPVGTYRLVGWGYQLPWVAGGAPPHRACLPRAAWSLHEAGWHLRDGGMELTPGITQRPAADPARSDRFYWHGRSFDLHFWIEEDGPPRVSLENAEAPERGVRLPEGTWVAW